MIYYSDDIAKGWDGKVQGKSGEGKQDVFIWKVNLKDVLRKKTRICWACNPVEITFEMLD